MTADPGPIGSAAIGSACAIFDDEGRILLVRHTYGKLNWELPGGLALPGEAPMAAAARELHEETGLRVADGELSGVYFEREHWTGPMLHFVFRFDAPDAVAAAARDAEIGEVGWFTLDALPRPMSDFTEARINDALAGAVAYRVVAERVWRS